MKRGSLLEGIALEVLQESVGAEVVPHDQNEFLTVPELPHAHALIDGRIPSMRAIVETKVPRPQTWAKIKRNGLPSEYAVQGIHNVAVARRVPGAAIERCVYGILEPVTMEMLVYQVVLDDVFEDRVLLHEREFYDAVLAGATFDEPEVEMSQPDTDEVVLDTDEARDKLREWLRVREVEGEAKALAESLRDEFLALTNDAPVIYVPGVDYVSDEGKRYPGVRVYHKRQPGAKGFDKDKAIKDFPILATPAYVKIGAPSRPVRVYPAMGAR